MRKIAFIFFLLICFKSKSQLGFSDYYNEKDLLGKLQKAKSPAEHLIAIGLLTYQYVIRFKDSFAAAYMDKIRKIAAKEGEGSEFIISLLAS